jgi:hypothetical protein
VNSYRIIAMMAWTDLYFKVELEHEEEERLERVIGEICRQVRKVYGVRSVEYSHSVSRTEEDG